jgi:hypothetical protein
MIYDPNNELTDEQLENLGNEDFDSMLEYLDGQAEYLKKFTKPLSSYHTKRFAAGAAKSSGKDITDEELKAAEKIGKKNEQEAFDIIKDRVAEYEKDNPKYKDEGIKNIKTHRSQWFD